MATPVHTHGYLYVVVLVVRISVYVHRPEIRIIQEYFKCEL